jgi:hypothetical protein
MAFLKTLGSPQIVSTRVFVLVHVFEWPQSSLTRCDSRDSNIVALGSKATRRSCSHIPHKTTRWPKGCAQSIEAQGLCSIDRIDHTSLASRLPPAT